MTSSDAGALMRVDTRSKKVVATVPTCDAKWHGPDAASGSIWLACYNEGQLPRLDSSSNKVVDRIRLGYGIHSSPWAREASLGERLSTIGEQKILRLDPKRARPA